MGDEQKSLIDELTQGRELARQLQVHINMPSSSPETRDFLVQKILVSYEKSLALLNICSRTGSSAAGNVAGTSESPQSMSASPRSEDSDRDTLKDQEPRDSSKKRKAMPRWTQQVRITPGTGLEGPLDDGFSWRKYGQKDILGAKYPRGYYRCTHRNVQGCLATKQVQRSDEDTTIFEITYRGRHTCNPASSSGAVTPPLQQPENQEQKPVTDSGEQTTSSHLLPPHHDQRQQHPQQLLLDLRNGLRIITDDLDRIHQPPFSSFNFQTPSNSAMNYEAHYHGLSPASIADNGGFVGNFSPSFISPGTSGSNGYFRTTRTTNEIREANFRNSESELAELNNFGNSGTNSPTVGMDFPFGNVELDPNFAFGSPGFFS